MATTLPADATKANSDAATDDPKQSILVDVAGAVDTINALKAALGQAAQHNVSDGLEIIAQAGGTPNDLKVRLQAVSGMLRTAAGIALDIAAVQKQSYTAVDDVGAADAVALTISPAITAYVKYQAFMALIVATNTAATTVDVNGLGAKSLKKWKVGAKVALEAGDLIVGMIAHMVYDGADVVLLNPPVGEDYILIRDEKPTTTHGGSFTSGDWRKRDLTASTLVDPGGHASVASNQITLTGGIYRCHAWAGAYGTKLHQIRLRDTTNVLTLAVGTSGWAFGEADHDGPSAPSHLSGRFTLAGSTVIELQHRCSQTNNTDGFGRANGFGEVEVYSEAEFWKER